MRARPCTPRTQAAAPSGDAPLLLDASIEAKLGAARCSLGLEMPADGSLAAALRALLPPQAAGVDVEAVLRALAAHQGGAAGAATPARELSAAVLSPPVPAAVPPDATHVFRGGRLHTLLKDERCAGHFIQAPFKMPVNGGLPGVGGQFVRLPPRETMEERLQQLREWGAALEPVTFGDLADFGGKAAGDSDCGREHVILPTGLVLPVFYSTERKEWLAHPKLRRALGLGGETAPFAAYSLRGLRGSGKCAHVYIKLPC